MHDILDKAIERARQWPEQQQRETAESLMAMDELGGDAIDLDEQEAAAIDEALAEVARGEFADPADVHTVFIRFRK